MRFAETLLAILAADEDAAMARAQAAVNAFPARFQAAYEAGMRHKLGLNTQRKGDLALGQELLERMAANKADFTLTFRRLADAAAEPGADAAVAELFADPTVYMHWAAAWRTRLADEGGSADARRAAMRKVNPAFIARNHRVEEALKIAEIGDYGLFERLLDVIVRPFDDQPANARYLDPPQPHEVVRATFCGT